MQRYGSIRLVRIDISPRFVTLLLNLLVELI